MWRAGMKWLLLILGSLIGAGYASGQEIRQFFGAGSGLAILLFTIIFSLSTYIVMKISFEEKTEHFLPVLEKLVGPRLAKVYDLLIILYLFTTTIVMIAGGGVTLQIFEIPFWTGVLLLSLCTVLLFFRGLNSILSVNSCLIPILVIGLLYALISFQQTHQSWPLNGGQLDNWPAGITFASLNILSVVAVLSAVGKELKGIGEVRIASVLSGLVFGIISFIYNETLVELADKLSQYEIPLFAVLEGASFPIFILMSALLCTAIYTTTISNILGLSSRFLTLVKWPRWITVILLLSIMLPFTSFGFSNLIAFLYPIYGLLNLYLLVNILLYPILIKWK
ncbi:GerAB/ArcD/ProY family transporter [Bacillus sp. CLL-7-23]|uniref:GerAB/ArcD/ProY family transporter n=1 Tax=Bacillus changyiensis TaxID=3004103 RepID=A0ABT4WY92_9BACI|nr:GerAB/ArcD/ProY family transporter [Bacillus changyiensis]MDA7025010.1 GerAB/ArcD/ProY family transporter [Bacillus changyiensis]